MCPYASSAPGGPMCSAKTRWPLGQISIQSYSIEEESLCLAKSEQSEKSTINSSQRATTLHNMLYAAGSKAASSPQSTLVTRPLSRTIRSCPSSPHKTNGRQCVERLITHWRPPIVFQRRIFNGKYTQTRWRIPNHSLLRL